MTQLVQHKAGRWLTKLRFFIALGNLLAGLHIIIIILFISYIHYCVVSIIRIRSITGRSVVKYLTTLSNGASIYVIIRFNIICVEPTFFYKIGQ